MTCPCEQEIERLKQRERDSLIWAYALIKNAGGEVTVSEKDLTEAGWTVERIDNYDDTYTYRAVNPLPEHLR